MPEALPIGTLVDYWRGEKKGEPSGRGVTRSEVKLLNGFEVVWIDGCSPFIALSHVEVVPAFQILTESEAV